MQTQIKGLVANIGVGTEEACFYWFSSLILILKLLNQ